MKKCYSDDLYRYYGQKESLRQFMRRPLELKYIIIFRKTQKSINDGKRLKGILYRLYLHRLRQKTLIQIPWATSIGKGFYIGHKGPVIINPGVSIGSNVNVASGVTIGQENRGPRKGSPIIGSEVWIGTNAVIVGNITIGNDVLIAPGSYVNSDVPSHSIVFGNPAVIRHSDHATLSYINHICTETEESESEK